MNKLIRKAARKWFYESFDCDLLAQMQEKGLIDQAEGFSVSVMAELDLEMESAFLSFQAELGAMKAERDDLQQRLTVAEQREAEAREELLDLSRKLDVFYSRSHGIKNLSAIEDANDKSKALQQRLTVAEQRADMLASAIRSAIKDAVFCRGVVELDASDIHALDDALKPAEGEGS